MQAVVVAELPALGQGEVALPDESGCRLGLALAGQDTLLVSVHSGGSCKAEDAIKWQFR